MNNKIIVGLSGGVDSAVTAGILVEQGHQVEALFMQNWEEDDSYCTAAEDFQDARQVAEELEIPLHKVNFATEYRERVFSYFLAEYKAGRTPNPDILCNREIKFNAFLTFAEQLGASHIATGHYARVHDAGNGEFQLLKGLDQNKDQSYFLHAVSGQALGKTLFPLGGLEKTKVRELALEWGFANHGKKDSTGICFIGERPFTEFLQKFLPAQPGEIVTTEGQTIAQHQGLMYYTIGQRKGLGIGGLREYSEDPWYVVDKDLKANKLIVTQGHDHPALHSQGLIATDFHWINQAAELPLRCAAKTRYRQTQQDCNVRMSQAGLEITFDNTQRAITPGQFVVLYSDDVCLGGGVIESSIPIANSSQATAFAGGILV